MRSFFETSVASRPNTSASPDVGKIRPSSNLSVVVLPDPLGPSSPKISPRRISKSSGFRATFLLRPQKSRYVLERLRASTTTSRRLLAWESFFSLVPACITLGSPFFGSTIFFTESKSATGILPQSDSRPLRSNGKKLAAWVKSSRHIFQKMTPFARLVAEIFFPALDGPPMSPRMSLLRTGLNKRSA